jgi:hypothetical protein
MSGDRRDMVDKFTENTGTQVRWRVGTGGWEFRMGKMGSRKQKRAIVSDLFYTAGLHSSHSTAVQKIEKMQG